MRRLVSLVVVIGLVCGCVFSSSLSYAQESTDGDNVMSALSDEQRNSIGVLNYLAYLTKEIENQKGNRLYLEDAYSALYNNTYMNSIDEVTLGQVKSLLTALHNFQMIATKRERLEYIYEQNQAQAIRDALPSPTSIMNVVLSGNWQKALVSVAYMAMDSISSYESSKNAADNEYLQDGWELDDEEKEILHSGHLDSLEYMWEIIHDYNLPTELAINENDIDRFVDWKGKDNLVARIQFLESNREFYQAFGEYWLLLAESYYDNGDMDKCLEAVRSYETYSTRIFRKDYHYAKVLPLAITAAAVTYNKDKYISEAERFASRIISNCDQEEWVLRYFAAETYVELSGLTQDNTYLQKAYDIALNNVNYLVLGQIESNKAYLAEVKPEPIPAGATKSKKEEIEKYNNGQKKARLTAVPPVSEALILNCDLLFALSEQLDIDSAKINAILYGNDDVLFLNPIIDNYYRKENKKEIVPLGDVIAFNGKEITVPAYLLTENTIISVGGLDNNGKVFSINDWKIKSVDRKDPNDLYSFVATFESSTAANYTYDVGSMVWVNFNATGDERTEDVQISFNVESKTDFLVPYTVFRVIE